jgi:pyruvate/2-oxoglutarate dehydrogenase complex dihydrolipoamide acyltransferase (E2) component
MGEHGFRPERVISYGISADHRVLDGATVAKFGSRVRQLLEHPDQMLMQMH